MENKFLVRTFVRFVRGLVRFALCDPCALGLCAGLLRMACALGLCAGLPRGLSGNLSLRGLRGFQVRTCTGRSTGFQAGTIHKWIAHRVPPRGRHPMGMEGACIERSGVHMHACMYGKIIPCSHLCALCAWALCVEGALCVLVGLLCFWLCAPFVRLPVWRPAQKTRSIHL